MSDESECRLCGAAARAVGKLRILGTRDVTYYACPACELLETERPNWLGDAYAKAMTALDTGAVARNQTSARLTELIARLADISATAPALDFGGGHGVFVRMMRDRGFDMRWYDTFADNLYADGFAGSPDDRHGLVTAFEVLEHLVDVGTELARLFAPRPDHVLVGTLLHHGWDPAWWYLMEESGQHVAFFSPATLSWIATHHGYQVLAGSEYALFRRDDLPLGPVRRRVIQEVLRRPQLALDAVGLVPEVVRRKLAPGASRGRDQHGREARRVRHSRPQASGRDIGADEAH
jgi:Methyltransferase domain